MLTSQDTGKLDAALAKAQGEFGAVTKDSQNPHFKTMFAGLDSVVNAIRAALSANGVSHVQSVDEVGEGHHVVTTRIAHGGEWILTTCPVMWEQSRGTNKAQAFGSGLTYARRYALMAAFGLAPEDDDGSSSSGRDGARDQGRQTQRRQDAPSGRTAPMKPQRRQDAPSGRPPPMSAGEFANLVEHEMHIPLAMLNRFRVEVLSKGKLTQDENEFHLAGVAKWLKEGTNAHEVRQWASEQAA